MYRLLEQNLNSLCCNYHRLPFHIFLDDSQSKRDREVETKKRYFENFVSICASFFWSD
jgi:hypothetical protein